MLEIKNVTLTYGERSILDDITLSFEQQKMIALTGKSGAGKSTLLGIMSGLLKPDNGTVLYNGQNIFKWGDWKRSRFRNRTMGFVFQFFNLFPDMTAYQNILYPASLNPHSDRDVKKQIDELVDLLSIEKIISQYPSTLSGGERQRVAIARAVINNPKLILADEPTGNLDDETTRGIIDLFIRLRDERGITTILATHENELVERSDLIYHIEEGRVEHTDEPAEQLKTVKKRKSDRLKKAVETKPKSAKRTTTKKSAPKKAVNKKSSKKKTAKKTAAKKKTGATGRGRK